ncbi:MAG: methyltransferase domain-containing protein [Actinomycetota bacterium]
MSVTRTARAAGNAAIARATWGGSQNFLGARWVERVVSGTPPQYREIVALRFLALSPHYFYDHDIRAEAQRNASTRRALTEALIAPHLTGDARVIDYGCGPGYFAAAVADKAAHVDAIDISRGVLACARTLNARPNISYRTPAQFRGDSPAADLAYSFAVVQHLTSESLRTALALLARKIRPGGTLLLHFAEPDPQVWRTEAQWSASTSIAGRVKLRYGLHCFGRTAEEMEAAVSASGFTGIGIRHLRGSLTVPGDDDITQQHWLTARRA